MKQEIDVGSVDDFRNGEMKEVTLSETVTALLVKTKYGKFYATSNKCTHYAVPLVKGVLNGDRVVCPAHGACMILILIFNFLLLLTIKCDRF